MSVGGGDGGGVKAGKTADTQETVVGDGVSALVSAKPLDIFNKNVKTSSSRFFFLPAEPHKPQHDLFLKQKKCFLYHSIRT